jgi:hypothetical protein
MYRDSGLSDGKNLGKPVLSGKLTIYSDSDSRLKNA